VALERSQAIFGFEPVLRSKMDCIDLQEHFGRQYRIGIEDGADRGDPWGLLLLCRHGHICPWGGHRLAACTNRRGPIANLLAKLPCVEVWADASDGITVLFDVADFDRVAEIIQPKRRRRLSPEHKAKLIEASRPFRFGHGSKCSSGERPATQTVRVDC
jgi:hypothetical protein